MAEPRPVVAKTGGNDGEGASGVLEAAGGEAAPSLVRVVEGGLECCMQEEEEKKRSPGASWGSQRRGWWRTRRQFSDMPRSELIKIFFIVQGSTKYTACSETHALLRYRRERGKKKKKEKAEKHNGRKSYLKREGSIGPYRVP